jgi:hypothetical protein
LAWGYVGPPEEGTFVGAIDPSPGLAMDHRMLKLAANQQLDYPEKTGFPA